jgi:hypothetical protein
MGMKPAVLALFLAMAAGAAALLWFQARMIYRFDTSPATPGTAGLAGWRVAAFEAADGTPLHAWLIPPRGDAPVVIYFTGNFTGPVQTAKRLQGLADSGLGFAMLVYRGAAGTPGRPAEAVLRADALALYDALDALAGRQIPASRRIGYGFSLGTGLALPLSLDRPLAGLILESGFASLTDYWARRYHFPPLRWLMWRERHDLTALLPRVTAPVLLLRGAKDRAIPAESFARLAAAAPAQAETRVYAEGGHNDLPARGSEADVLDFIRRATGLPQ